MENQLNEKVKELIKKLDNVGFEYKGFDYLNLSELFVKKLDFLDISISISILLYPNGISIEGSRYDLKNDILRPFTCNLTIEELDYFNQLLNIKNKINVSFPKELIKK